MGSEELVVLDIDGCVTPNTADPADLAALDDVQTFIDEKVGKPVIMLTGRPAQFAYCIMRILGVHLDNQGFPSIVEYGNQFIDHKKPRTAYLHPESGMNRSKIMKLVEREIEDSSSFVEIGKHHIISVKVQEDPEALQRNLKNTLSKKGFLKDIEFRKSQTAIDIIPEGTGKKPGLQYLLQRKNIDPENVIGIGDSSADLEWLEFIGDAYCPVNSSEDLLESDQVANLKSKDSRAVLQMLNNHF